MIESDLTAQIIGGAIEVHKHWGPDLSLGCRSLGRGCSKSLCLCGESHGTVEKYRMQGGRGMLRTLKRSSVYGLSSKLMGWQ